MRYYDYLEKAQEIVLKMNLGGANVVVAVG